MHDVRRQPRAGAAAALDPRGAPLYPDEGDVWIKAADARQHVRNPLTGEYRQSIGGIVVGADRAFGTGAARWRGGVLTGYTNVYRHFDDGNSRSESAQFGAYATWSGADGTYVGGVALVNSYSHRLTAHGSDGSRAKARFDSTGAGVSLEAGRRLDLRDSIFVEPYVGIDYYRAGGAKYMTGNGMSVRDPGGYSFQLRTGARGGVTWETADGSLVRPYVRAGWAQELGNRNRVELNGIDFSYEGSGGRLEAGAGVEAMIAKRHFVYLDYGYATGHDMRQPWSVGAGYRYVW
jgi:outer membrane autotransporter protein